MKAPIIDTLQTLELIQRALAKSSPGDELAKTATSALSAVIPYIKTPEASVQQKHYQAIQALHEAMK